MPSVELRKERTALNHEHLILSREKLPYYFAFGSNIDLHQMLTVRCPAAKLVAGCLELPDWKYRLSANGGASIDPSSGSVCYGAVFEVTETCIKTLDHYEGIEAGHYYHQMLSVPDSWPIDHDRGVFLYLSGAAASKSEPSATPRPGYQQQILTACEHLEYPPKYLEELRSWLPLSL